MIFLDYEYLKELEYIKRKRCFKALFCFDIYDGNDDVYDYIRDNDVSEYEDTALYISVNKNQCMITFTFH